MLIIITLLTTNVLTLVSSTAYRFASFAIDTILDGTSLRSRSQVELTRIRLDIERSEMRRVELGEELVHVRQERAILKTTIGQGQGRVRVLQEETFRMETKLAQIETDLLVERGRSSQLNNQLVEAQAIQNRNRIELDTERSRIAKIEVDLEAQRSRRASQVDLIDVRTRTITTRARQLVAREVSSMPLESIPWFGIATIVTTTGLELKDLCDTSKDMQAIREAVGLSDPLVVGTNEICGTEIWTVSELIAWVWGGEGERIEERCRRLVEDLGLLRPEDCPTIEALPPIPSEITVPPQRSTSAPHRPVAAEKPVVLQPPERQTLPPRP